IAATQDWAISRNGELLKGVDPFRKITTDQVRVAVFAPNGNAYAVATDRGVLLGETASPPGLELGIIDSASTSLLRFSQNSRRLIVVEADQARLWDIKTRGEIWRFRAKSGITAVDFNPDGAVIAVADEEGYIYLLDARDGRAMITRDG